MATPCFAWHQMCSRIPFCTFTSWLVWEPPRLELCTDAAHFSPCPAVVVCLPLDEPHSRFAQTIHKELPSVLDGVKLAVERVTGGWRATTAWGAVVWL